MRSGSGKKKVLLGILGIALFAVMAGAVYIYIQMSSIKKVDIPTSNEELDISSDASALDSDVTNIALFGVDSRDSTITGRSDSIMILSIDRKHSKIKLSSIMRDSYVDVEGHGMTKITHAYAYGGPALAIKTLNSNFDLNIKDYVTVNFEGMQKIVDSLGGVEIDIKSYEIESMKKVGIYSSGTYNLNGAQALEYSRIRYQGNGDFERTDRQRTVLSAILEKIRSAGAVKFPAMASSVLPYVETSMSQGDIIKLGTAVLTSNIGTLEQVRFPADGYCEGKMIGGVWYLVFELDPTVKHIHAFIYDDQSPPGQ